MVEMVAVQMLMSVVMNVLQGLALGAGFAGGMMWMQSKAKRK